MVKVTWAPSSIKYIHAIAEYIAKDSISAAKKIILYLGKDYENKELYWQG